MNLWIRSQDKRKLIKASSIILDVSLSSKETGIKGYFGSNQYAMLGYYKNEKRALEVLDEINDEISYYVGTTAQIVYQMPKE